MKNNNKIACFQLLNDYSGSPKVLKSVLQILSCYCERIDLYTSNTNGVLDELKSHKNIHLYTYQYHFSTNRIVTMIRYIWIQMLTFLLSFKYFFSKDVVFYINTLLPIGPALAGRIIGKRVVYHYHENANVKGIFYKALAVAMQMLAHNIICVSKYQSQFLASQNKVTVVPNAIPTEFLSKLTPDINSAFERKRVLMLGSLKEYKGITEFYQLATKLFQYPFTLVINDTQENIETYVRGKNLKRPSNLTVFARQQDVSRFYNTSSIVLNLSNKNLFVETFGLTVLEAMSAALPVIVPTEGGIAEMVDDGVNGYKIDVQQLDKIAETISKILSDKQLYEMLSQNALKCSNKFNDTYMANKISEIIWR